MDCRNCIQWETCLCGKPGHDKGTSIGYSIGECKEYQECSTAERPRNNEG